MSKPSWLPPLKIKKTNKKRKTKINSVKVTHDGYEFDSVTEGRYYLHLKQLHKDGVVQSFEMQKKYVLQEAYVIDGHKRERIMYTPDFVVTYADGRKEVVDVKGSEKVLSRDFPLRQKLFEERYEMRLYVMLWRKGQWVERDTYVKSEAARKRRATIAKKKWEAKQQYL